MPDRSRIAEVMAAPAHTALNLEVARRSLVLLRNDGTLPLEGAAAAPRRIALVGPLADHAQTQLGDWAGSSGEVDWLDAGQPRGQITTVLDGLRSLLPDDWTLTHTAGAEIPTLEDDPAGAFFPDGQPRPKVVVPVEPDDEMIAEAVAAAREADVVVAVVGDRIELVGDGRSTATLELVGGQRALLEALAATGTPLVVVLMASKPLVLPDAVADAPLVRVANPGMQGGQAIAELLLGRIEPAGRLPISFARHVGQQPTYDNQVRGQHGDRYADLTQRPAHAFGEGLSYTTVEYGAPALEASSLSPADTVRARVTLEVPVADCTIVDATGARIVEPGAFELLIGSSSRDEDLRSVSFTVAAA